MKNIEKYKDIIIDNTDVCSINRLLLKKNIKGFCSGHSCAGCKERAIKWLLEEYKEPVLDETEKEYLSALIKPFREKVQCISKWYESNDYFIKITVLSNHSIEYICLPYFNLNCGMYKGMIPFREYNLKDLGL